LNNSASKLEQILWRGIAAGLLLLGAIFTVIVFVGLEFNPDSRVWFTADYYSQFLPLYITVTLALAGIYALLKLKQANLFLAMFGHTASEEIVFSWMGFTQTALSFYAICIFFPISILSLWLAYSNRMQLKRLSLAEAVFGFLLSLVFVFAPRSF
jgi:magnesium-transporting ATPase (P-type)